MFGNYKTLRRLKRDYGKFQINGSLNSEIDIEKDKIEKRRFLRPAIRFSACAVAAVALILVGTFSPSLLRNFGASDTASSSQSEISHDFALTAYAVNNTTNKKTKITFGVNFKVIPGTTCTCTYYDNNSIRINAVNRFEFKNCISNNMSSVTYTAKSGQFYYTPSKKATGTHFYKSLTFKTGTEHSTFMFKFPSTYICKISKSDAHKMDFSKLEGHVITVTAKFKDGQTATKIITIKFTKDGRLLTKEVNK